MAEIEIDKDHGIVEKRIFDNEWTRIDKPFEREIHWLKTLYDFDRAPKLICTAPPNKIVMTYCGEKITRLNIPENWKEQAEYILAALKDHGCCHNDIKPEEILVKDGLLYLVDYNWATGVDEPIPPNWPPALGVKYKFSGGFDDRHSFYLSVQCVRTGRRVGELKHNLYQL